MKKKFLQTKILIFLLLNLLLILAFQSCKSPTGPGKDGGENNYSLNLSIVEVSCTEAWANLENKSAVLPLQVSLTINNAPLAVINLTVQDTIIYLDSLLPNKIYALEGKYTTNNQRQATNKLNVQTLDTTSHNFMWQTFIFGGGGGSSVLTDVAIVCQSIINHIGAGNTGMVKFANISVRHS